MELTEAWKEVVKDKKYPGKKFNELIQNLAFEVARDGKMSTNAIVRFDYGDKMEGFSITYIRRNIDFQNIGSQRTFHNVWGIKKEEAVIFGELFKEAFEKSKHKGFFY